MRGGADLVNLAVMRANVAASSPLLQKYQQTYPKARKVFYNLLGHWLLSKQKLGTASSTNEFVDQSLF